MNNILIGPLLNEGDFLILNSPEKYYDIKSIISINENFKSEIGTYSKEFRISYDGYSFGQWIELTIDNLNKITFKKDLWFDFKYTLTSSGNLDINYVYLNCEYNKQPVVDKPFPYAYPRDKGNKRWPIRLRSFSWNPYKQESAIKLQEDLSLISNQLYGHSTLYFRAIPDETSKDIIFLEYTLQNVNNDPRELKVVVPDNTFPDRKFNFNAFGIDFDMPFEVHIDKRYFDMVFGLNTKPQKRDILYFPLTNRLYEVDSVSINGQFMHDPLFWQVSLIKYQQKINVNKAESVSEFINNLTIGLDSEFSNDLNNEYKDITNPQQLKDKSSKFDPIRTYVSSFDISIPYQFQNYYTTIFEYYYDMYKHYKNSNMLNKAVEYNVNGLINNTDDISYTVWLSIPTLDFKSKDILSFEINEDILTVRFSMSPIKTNINSFVKIFNTNVGDFVIFGTVVNIQSTYLEVKVDNLEDINISYPDWINNNGYKIIETTKNNLLYCYENNKGINITLIDSRYINILINENEYIFEINKLNNNTWYALVINVLNNFNQISYHLYTTKDKSFKTTKLKLIQNEILNLYNFEFDINLNYQILASPIYLSNIRLLKYPLEDEIQSKFLNMQYLQDASKALIIDNCIPRMKLPYIGDPK